MIYGELIKKYCYTGEPNELSEAFLVIKIKKEFRKFCFEILRDDEDNDYIIIELFINPLNNNQIQEISETEYLTVTIMES